jgi:hypothetical protein
MAHAKRAIEIIFSGSWNWDRADEVATPIPPNVVAKKKPEDEQPTHALEIMLIDEPDRNEPLILTAVFLKICTFMATTTPSVAAVMFDSTKLATASAGT